MDGEVEKMVHTYFHTLTILHSFCSDECTDGSHKCDTGMGAKCVNEIGNYTCICPSGYLTEWNKCVGKLWMHSVFPYFTTKTM